MPISYRESKFGPGRCHILVGNANDSVIRLPVLTDKNATQHWDDQCDAETHVAAFCTVCLMT